MRNTKLVLLAALICVPAITRAVTVITSLPYSITKPGSYVLESNLTAAGTDGIDIKNASNVSINLNGYTLTGDTSGIGINAQGEINNIIVQNGAITGFGSGVNFDVNSSNASQRVVLKNLRLLDIPETGISLAASDCLVENCSIIGTGGDTTVGIAVAGGAALIKNNRISGCGVGIASAGRNALIGNYVANCENGLLISYLTKYQGNITTNCGTPVKGGTPIGHENG